MVFERNTYVRSFRWTTAKRGGIAWPNAQNVRERLEARLGPLNEFLGRVVPSEKPSLEELVSAVVEACVGAANFKLVGGGLGPPPKQELARFLKGVPLALKKLGDVHAFLLDHADNMERIAERLEADLTWDYGASGFPAELKGAKLVDLLERLAMAIESEAADSRKWAAGHISYSPPAEVRRHGCFDYGRVVPRENGRGVHVMLAFQLELIFRNASAGRLASLGEMPTDGKPHRPEIAKLVVATLEKGLGDRGGRGATAEDMPADADETIGYQVEGSKTEITEYWVHSTVKDVIRQHPHITVVRWP